MDDYVDSTQRFDVQADEPNEDAVGVSSTYEENEPIVDESNVVNEYATQAFTAPGTLDEYEEDGGDEIEQTIETTQAFVVEGTQAFSTGTYNDDPLLYDNSVVVDSTQQFTIAEYSTVNANDGATSAAAGVNDSSDYNLSGDGQSYVGGLVVTEGDDAYEQEVAGEEVVQDEVPFDEAQVELEEIASPDPEEIKDEEEEEENDGDVVQSRQRNRVISDDDEQQEDSETSPKRAAKLYVQDDEEDDTGDHAVATGGSDGEEEEEKKSEVGELIANIFGDSDEEGGGSDAEGKEEQASTHVRKANLGSGSEKDSDDEVRAKLVVAPDFVSDFDLMMERRRAENSRRYRKRKDYDIVNDSDDVINDMITQMKNAAKTDSDLNKQRKPALTKRKLLPTVVKQLKKSDLRSAFIELGVVNAIADWLYPLPDGSLPAMEIRTELLKILHEFPTLDHQILKSSQIGKAVMILYKHPRETKENKERAGKLINEWARPIFNLQSDYRSLTKEDRLQLDYEHMPLAKKRRMSSMDAENKLKADGEKEDRPLRPGDKGWIGRARVPQPSTKDYVVRPKWNIEGEIRAGTSKKGTSMIDRKIREIKERTKAKKALRAIGVSIEGRKML